MDKYISKIANMTQTEVRVERLALEIAEKTKDSNIADGKAPNGIAAAYLYVASVLLGQNVLQRDVSSIAGVTEVTIRNRCKEISNLLQTQNYFETITGQNLIPPPFLLLNQLSR